MDVDAATGKGEEDSAEAEKSALAGKHHLSLMLMCCSTKTCLKKSCIISSLLLHCVLHCTGKHGGDHCSSKPGPELLGKSSRPHPLLFEVSAVAKVFVHF